MKGNEHRRDGLTVLQRDQIIPYSCRRFPAYLTRRVSAKDQNAPKIHIHLMISAFLPPNALANMVPPGGDSKMGVKKAIPGTPYALHILANRLVFLEKRFCLLLPNKRLVNRLI